MPSPPYPVNLSQLFSHRYGPITVLTLIRSLLGPVVFNYANSEELATPKQALLSLHLPFIQVGLYLAQGQYCGFTGSLSSSA